MAGIPATASVTVPGTFSPGGSGSFSWTIIFIIVGLVVVAYIANKITENPMNEIVFVLIGLMALMFFAM